ncbi:MAG: NAD(P)H-dependent oxidoreductase [candidate division NC10 bacterium]|nr:NAD(P)H-dependent oxidoreductase [candidate division NC10 bacterium]MBI4840684.1 NAD(P)H-dependent oxidoreductase [candidate division NC10 bacterium]
MAKLLHIQASPMDDLSFSARTARAFLDAYRKAHPADPVETLDLWKADIPAFDFTAASGKYKVMRGLPHADGEGRAWQRVVELVDHFKSADKILLSSPMWNFGIPYRLKQYIDVIVQPGLTFSYDPKTGYSGLVTGRPVQLILARGGEYPQGSQAAGFDHQRPYLELILGFIGFTDVRTLVVEPTLSPAGDEKLAVAISAAQEAARNF